MGARVTTSTPKLNLPLEVAGKAEFEQSVVAAFMIIGERTGLTLSVRTEGIVAFRQSYKIAIAKIAEYTGMALPTSQVDCGITGFKADYIQAMLLIDQL